MEFSQSPHEEPLAGFDRPQVPKDNYAAGLYEQFELGSTPSIADIEPIATTLLSHPATTLEGMGLVLGREVGAQELKDDPELGLVMLFGQPGEKFGILLLMKSFASSEQTEQ
jgi:hypothetical protein